MSTGYQLASVGAARRARRRALLERIAIDEAELPVPVPPGASVAEGALILLGEFEHGDELLHGYPKSRVDFVRARASLKEKPCAP